MVILGPSRASKKGEELGGCEVAILLPRVRR